MKTTVPQVLDEVEKANTFQEKVATLQKYNTTALRGLLNMNFNPGLVFNLPQGDPPFKKRTDLPIGTTESNLYAEYRRFYIWLTPNELSRTRREHLFIQLLEGIHYTEAELVLAVKDRKLTHKWPSVSAHLVRAAFPTLLPEVLAEIPAITADKKEIKAKPKKASGAGSKTDSAEQIQIQFLNPAL